MKLKLKWKVDPASTGRYRSLSKRAWPTAEYSTGEQAARIECEEEYAPWKVKEGVHKELRVRIADHRLDIGFEWKTLKARFTDLQSAKDGAFQFLSLHPEWHPKPKPIPKIIKLDVEMEIDQARGVIYLHSKEDGHTLLRICSLPTPIPDPNVQGSELDITHMNGCSWRKS